MLRNSLPILLLAVLPLAASCTDAETTTDELAGDEADLAADGKADRASDPNDTLGYYQIRRDLRRCSSPQCGGYFVARVNTAQTRCADGRFQAECYVASLDLSGTGLSGRELEPFDQKVGFRGNTIVRGAIGSERYPGVGTFGRFAATEAWVAGAAAGQIDGVAVKVEQTGIRCIAAPCADKRELKVNGSATAMIADLDFEASGATQAELEDAYAALISEGPTRLMVYGYRYTVRDGGRSEKARSVEQFYLKLPMPAAAAECFVGGCSSQICSDRPDVISTCEWRDEYACYASATCERQADGACGWTPTAELEACLAAPPAPPMSVEACETAGGRVRADIGDGQIRCEANERELGRVAVGIEGGVCCLAL